MDKKISIVIAFLTPFVIFCQKSFNGVLLDSINKTPIAFANIGVVGKGLGTVTNEKGEFKLAIPDSLLNNNVKISVLGYKPKTYSGGNLNSGVTIYMAPNLTALNEVVVQAKNTKIKMLGNDTKTRHVSAGFKNNSLGAELAIRLNIKHQNTQLRKFFININTNSLGIPLFRFNVYSINEKGMPKENILKKNILIEPKEKTGLVEFDLLPYDLYVDDDVFISIEWIKDLGDVTGLSFSTKLVGHATYYRVASQDEWHKIPSIGIGLHVEVGY